MVKVFKTISTNTGFQLMMMENNILVNLTVHINYKQFMSWIGMVRTHRIMKKPENKYYVTII